MSDKHTDDRDIDEVLASIDEMLAEKQLYSYKPSPKQGLLIQQIKATTQELKASAQASTKAQTSPATDAAQVKPAEKEAVKPTKIMLGASEFLGDDAPEQASDAKPAQKAKLDDAKRIETKRAETKQPETKNIEGKHIDELPFDEISDDQFVSDDAAAKPAPKASTAEKPEARKPETSPPKDFIATPRHRVVLTEALLAPSAQEALPLWVEEELPEFQEPQTQSPQDAAASSGNTAGDKKHASQSIEQTELVEAIVQDALLPSTDKPEITNEMAPIINKYEVEQLVRTISEDVSTQLQQYIRNILPKLVQKSLQQHFDATTKDTE